MHYPVQADTETREDTKLNNTKITLQQTQNPYTYNGIVSAVKKQVPVILSLFSQECYFLKF